MVFFPFINIPEQLIRNKVMQQWGTGMNKKDLKKNDDKKQSPRKLGIERNLSELEKDYLQSNL